MRCFIGTVLRALGQQRYCATFKANSAMHGCTLQHSPLSCRKLQEHAECAYFWVLMCDESTPARSTACIGFLSRALMEYCTCSAGLPTLPSRLPLRGLSASAGVVPSDVPSSFWGVWDFSGAVPARPFLSNPRCPFSLLSLYI